MSIRETVRWVTARMLPWAPRHERKAALEAAREARDASRVQAAQAAQTVREIRRIAYTDNHFAAAIIETLRDRPGRGRSGER